MSSLVSSQSLLMKMTAQHFIVLGAFVALVSQEKSQTIIKNSNVVPMLKVSSLACEIFYLLMMCLNIIEHRITKGAVESVCFYAFNAMISCMLINIISVGFSHGLMLGWALTGFAVFLLQLRAIMNQIRGWRNEILHRYTAA
jgi:hypothetical protein